MENPVGDNLKITKDATVCAGWTAVRYSVTYDFDGGALEDGKTNPDGYTIESENITLAAPVRTGYAFDGWYSNGNRIQTILKGSYGDLSLTAKWVKDGYSITYNETKGAQNDNPLTYVISDGAILLKDIERRGYTFDGWYDGENKITEIAANSTGNLTLTAGWTLNVYTITYLGPNDEVLDLDGFDLPATYTVEDEDIPLNEYYLTGYNFRRWTKNGLTVGYIPAGSVGDIVLYGEFQDDTTFAINYIDEFGNENYENPQSYELNEVLSELLPLKDMIDKKFVGWSNGFEIVRTIDTTCGGP